MVQPIGIKLQIFATGKDGKRFEIDDLYWFEEEMISSFDDAGWQSDYTFDFVVNGIPLTPENVKNLEPRPPRWSPANLWRPKS